MRVLIENPIILMILIGIISSVFNRIKNSQPEDARSQKRNQQRTGSPVEQHKKFDKGDTRSKQNKPVRQQKTYESMVKNTEDSFDPILINNNIQASDNNHKDYFAAIQKPIETHELESTQKKKTLAIDQTTLIDGLIWSEVLGPPRAKKIHHSMKAYGKKQ